MACRSRKTSADQEPRIFCYQLADLGNCIRRHCPGCVLSVFFLTFVYDPPSNIVRAAPVKYQFSATITQVQGDATALNLPFALHVGQQVNGCYSFATEQAMLDVFLHHELGVLGQVSLAIDGTEMPAAANLGLLNSVAILDPPITGPTDSISLGYLSPTNVFPGWPGSVAGQLWTHDLVLVGADGTITAPEQLLDASTWNQLTMLRRLDIQFGFPNTVMVQAMVGDFIAVPEPTSDRLLHSLVGIGVAYALLARKVLERKGG
ncbi:MAG: hypothetical protein IT425_14070 [Pirellulales bacterium]|nr:hypothetical protein [Pirellulales bacterium]